MVKGVVAGFSSQPGVWQEYILRKFIDMLEPELVFGRYAEPASIPKGEGAYIARWNLPVTQAGTLTALSQTDPTDHEFTGTTITQVTGAIADYGDWFKVSDLAKTANLRQTLDTYAEQVTQMGAQVIDTLVRNAGLTSTNFLHAGKGVGNATLATTDKLTLEDFPVIAGFFRGKNAKGWKNLSNDYMLAIEPAVEVNLVTDVTTTRLSWSEANKYVPKGFDQLIDNHQFVGRFNGLSCLRTTNIGIVSEDVSAYQCLALARYGVGRVGLGTKGPLKPSIKYKSPGPNDTYQPLDTYHTIGWKVRMVTKLLDANRALVVYSATGS